MRIVHSFYFFEKPHFVHFLRGKGDVSCSKNRLDLFSQKNAVSAGCIAKIFFHPSSLELPPFPNRVPFVILFLICYLLVGVYIVLFNPLACVSCLLLSNFPNMIFLHAVFSKMVFFNFKNFCWEGCFWNWKNFARKNILCL